MTGDEFFTTISRASEYLLLDQTEQNLVSHTLFQCPTKNGKDILVTPTVHNNLLLDPTATKVNIPSSTDTTPTRLATAQQLAAKTVSNINFRQVITFFTGVRASAETDDFIPEASKAIPGLIHAGGVDSPGLTCCVPLPIILWISFARKVLSQPQAQLG